jgi:hypothetical protein
MKKEFVIHSIANFKGWEGCFHYLMERSDNFKIIFQGEKDDTTAGELNTGKKEFLNLPLLAISTYAGMENSIELAGELNKAAQELFQNFMASSFNGLKPDLWSFQFLKGNLVNLRVEDFSVGLLFLDESELEDLTSRDIDTKNLEEVDLSLALGKEHVLSVTGDDAEDLSIAIRNAFTDLNS